MIKLTKEELVNITGGANLLTASFLNSVARCIDALLEIGRSIGSSIRRISSNNICP